MRKRVQLTGGDCKRPVKGWARSGREEDEDEGIKAGEPEVGTVFLETHIRLLHRCEISNVSIPTQTFNKESSQLIFSWIIS